MLNCKHKNDILLCLALVLLALIGFVIFKATLKEGSTVNVLVDGKITQSFSLTQAGEHTIKTKNGSNVLVIEDGQAFIKSADCPDKICVEHRKISKTGETIVCLPHKLVVEITENEKN